MHEEHACFVLSEKGKQRVKTFQDDIRSEESLRLPLTTVTETVRNTYGVIMPCITSHIPT